jgi:hypothetical protein
MGTREKTEGSSRGLPAKRNVSPGSNNQHPRGVLQQRHDQLTTSHQEFLPEAPSQGVQPCFNERTWEGFVMSARSFKISSWCQCALPDEKSLGMYLASSMLVSLTQSTYRQVIRRWSSIKSQTRLKLLRLLSTRISSAWGIPLSFYHHLGAERGKSWLKEVLTNLLVIVSWIAC